MTDQVAVGLLLVSADLVPGTDVTALGQRLADAVVYLPVPAAAMVGVAGVAPDVREHARELGERQGMATAAADLAQFYVRLHFRSGAALRAEGFAVAVACVGVWEERVREAAGSGLLTVTCLPLDEERWMRGAGACRELAVTAEAPAGLLPAG